MTSRDFEEKLTPSPRRHISSQFSGPPFRREVAVHCAQFTVAFSAVAVARSHAELLQQQVGQEVLYMRLVAVIQSVYTAFYTVVPWRELGEVENEYISYNSRQFAIFVPKIIRFGGRLT